ncbi:hypothetical protein AYO44_13140 [Planctomycetaceae bacterium SCGC AG-212-F19]|nr:hypothetical protein AYO44_13140 [Planctomycetaceae bacterium SCGC AG-212-F19]
MIEQVREELEGIGNLVNAASISDEDKRVAGWCLQKLPGLCEAFRDTYESRYADEIVRLERGLLMRLGEPKSSSPMRELAAALTTRFRTLHEHMGLPELAALKTRAAAPSRSKKTA